MTLRRLQYLAIGVTVLATFLVELLSDTVLDEALPFPVDTLIVTLAVLAGVIVLSTVAFRVIDRLQHQLRVQNDELEARNAAASALRAMTISITALADLGEVLRATAANARKLLSADIAALVLVGADGEDRLVSRSGPDAGFDESGGQAGPDEPSLAEGGPDLAGGRFLRPAFTVSYLASPLQLGGATVGTLAVGTARPRAFGVGDLETLGSLAAQAAIAIENDRLQRELRALAIHAERERIAREMHDGLAQVLGYVNTKSQAVEELLAAGRTTEAQTQMRELSAAARSTYVDVREAILGLTTPLAGSTTADGLGGALETYARRFAESSKIAVRVETGGSLGWDDLRPEVMANLLRIVQEALTNVRKHAAAQRVVVHLDHDAGRALVTIEDDGRGFDPDAPDVSADWPHFGRETIRQRAAAIGGTATWESSPGTGTRLRVEVPA
jgi:signal transduction histidine kinase